MENKKYDIFVSYSRADLDIVSRLVGDIHDKTSARCWVDWDGIESGDQFVDVIINAIDKVETVLFILSDNSMSSVYVKKEIAYARNTGKKVVPVVVDGGKLRGWFLFEFGQTDYIDVNSPMQYDKLIRNFGEWYGCTPAVAESVQMLEMVSKPVIHSADSQRIYKIGDYYDENGKQGIVFDVTADGKHGKIVSLDGNRAYWAFTSWESVGAASDDDGIENLNKIKTRPGWTEDYPAFAWCVSKGDGWYLPVRNELLLIFKNRDAINNCLIKRGFQELQIGVYWSSTESVDKCYCACFVSLRDGYTNCEDKYSNNNVRAVAIF